MAGKRAVGLDLHAACAIELGARRGGEHPAERRGLYAGGPDLRRRLDAAQSRIGRIRFHPALVDVGHRGSQQNLDAQVSQVARAALSQRVGKGAENRW